MSLEVDLSSFAKQELWRMIVELATSGPMYKHRRGYVRDVLLKEKPNIRYRELSLLLNIPLGEAIVILSDLGQQVADQKPASEQTKKDTDLLSFRSN